MLIHLNALKLMNYNFKKTKEIFAFKIILLLSFLRILNNLFKFNYVNWKNSFLNF